MRMSLLGSTTTRRSAPAAMLLAKTLLGYALIPIATKACHVPQGRHQHVVANAGSRGAVRPQNAGVMSTRAELSARSA